MTCTSAHSALKFKIKVTQIEINKISKNRYSINCTVNHTGLSKVLFEDTNVILTDEKLRISGEIIDSVIRETDFLYAQMNYDLNNDKDYDDIYKLGAKRGKYYYMGIPLQLIKSSRKFNGMDVLHFLEKGKLRTNLFDKHGFPFIVDNIDYNSKILTTALPGEKNPIDIIEFPNPIVKIMVIKNVGNINKKAGHSFSGDKSYITYSNEKFFDEKDNLWTSILWTAKPLILKGSSSIYNFSLNNISPPFAVKVLVLLSFERGICLRSEPSIKFIP